jgi:hydrogenase expression/formation protein HypE
VTSALPLGKLPADLLARLVGRLPLNDARVLLGPGTGLDCAVIDLSERLLVFKSDPITFASDAAGWYAVQVNANDIATTGATARWMLVTLLLPEGSSTAESTEMLFEEIASACRALDISVIGGHSEVTHGLDRPIVCGTMIGEVAREDLITPRGARPGNRLLLTKGVPIEAVSLLAREFAERMRMRAAFSEDEIALARGYLTDPGIGVTRDAQIAIRAARQAGVTAMHDPTEGGLASALWELAEASGCGLLFEPGAVPITPLAARICAFFKVDPLAAIASGALLMAVEQEVVGRICQALQTEGIACAEIGQVIEGPVGVWLRGEESQRDLLAQLVRPTRDEIARVFENL